MKPAPTTTPPHPTATSARILLDMVMPRQRPPAPTDAMADKAMTDFMADISKLDQRHNKGKTLTQDQLAEQVFRRRPVFKDEKAMLPYFRYQLRVAFEELNRLDQDMRKPNNGSLTALELAKFAAILRDYLFDLREILGFLQRNDPTWSFFDGGKASGITSWEVYRLAYGLAHHSTYTGIGPYLDHKAAQIASIFVLRQAMELRFERMIAVYPFDPNGNPPKLKHGFHQDFIAANPAIFQADGFEVKKLRHLYDWCSEIVHQAYQPYAWQISMALRRAGDLLQSRSVPLGKAWSIYNAVCIPDVEAMQTTYENHFLAAYGHGTWKFARHKPEALLRNWRDDMVTTGQTFRPVLNRPGRLRRMVSRIKQMREAAAARLKVL